MSQTILVEKNVTLDTVFALNLNIYVGTDVISKRNHEDTIDLLKCHESIDLIITRNEINGQKTAIEIYKFLQQSGREIPMIVLGPESLLEKQVVILSEKAEVVDVIRSAANVLGITPKDMAKKHVPDYYPIPIVYFASTPECTCPVYLRLKTSTGYQFIKRFEVHDHISMNEMEALIQKGITKLYVPKNDRLRFATAVTAEIISKLQSTDLDVGERIQLTNTSIEILRDQLLSAGLSDETVDLAKSTMRSIETMVQKTPQLKMMLELLLNDKTTLRYRSTQLTTFLAFHVLNNIEWGTSEQQHKLAFIALFHDIVLDDDKLFKVRNEDDLKSATLTEKENFKVLTHALESARLIQNFPHSPLGAETIIKQHHGSLSGTGFPKKYSNNISPLAIIFVICEEYAVKLLTAKKNSFNHRNTILELKEKFPKSLYLKVIRTLQNLSF